MTECDISVALQKKSLLNHSNPKKSKQTLIEVKFNLHIFHP